MKSQIKAIIDMDNSPTALQDRKETVLAKTEVQGKLIDQLKAAIEAAKSWQTWKKLYLPYKEKRRTKATIAREAGLFPLARLILGKKIVQTSKIRNYLQAFPVSTRPLWVRPYICLFL